MAACTSIRCNGQPIRARTCAPPGTSITSPLNVQSKCAFQVSDPTANISRYRSLLQASQARTDLICRGISTVLVTYGSPATTLLLLSLLLFSLNRFRIHFHSYTASDTRRCLPSFDGVDINVTVRDFPYFFFFFFCLIQTNVVLNSSFFYFLFLLLVRSVNHFREYTPVHFVNLDQE